MRSALIAWDYPPSPSGLSTAAREIAEGLAAAGVDVTVFTLDRTGRETAGPVTIVGCDPPPSGALARLRPAAGIGRLAAPIALRRAVLAEHARHAFDVVEATNYEGPAAFLAGRCPLPVVTRNSTPAAFSRDPARTLGERLDGRAVDGLERRQAASSAGLISNTAEHARRIASEYGLVEGAVPHAVIGLSLPPRTLERGRSAAYPGVAQGEPLRLLFVGRADHRKGFDTILGALARLDIECAAGAIPSFELTLAGVTAGDLPSSIPASLRARIRPVGRVPEADLALHYERSHAVLAPSRYESFGLVYQEAIAYGRPLAASAEDASAREFVGASGAGLLAERNDAAALAAVIRPILTDAGIRAGLRANALRASGRFTRETLGRETKALYEAAIARLGSRRIAL